MDREPKSELGTAWRLRERGSEMLGRKGFPELALLHDLREIYTKACGVSADWEMLAQTAQGIQHLDLLAVVQRCHPETLRQMKRANAAIKENSIPDLGELTEWLLRFLFHRRTRAVSRVAEALGAVEAVQQRSEGLL